MARRSERLAILAVLFLVLSGCSRHETLYPVHGRVTFSDGTPVTFGVVECFSASHHTTARGSIGSDGTFQLETPGKGNGVVEGTHQVIVIQNVFPLGKADNHTGHTAPPRRIARRYSRYDSTPLTLNVSPSEPNVDVVLTVEESR